MSAPGCYFLYGADAYQTVRVGLIDVTTDRWASNWTAAGRSDAPFYAWAMHVDSQGGMYFSDRPRPGEQTHGRVAKMAVNQSEMGEWTMTDGTAYAFTSIAFDSQPTADSVCAY